MLLHQKGESASFGIKMAMSLNAVDPGCMNPITGSTCRANCSNILHHNGARNGYRDCVVGTNVSAPLESKILLIIFASIFSTFFSAFLLEDRSGWNSPKFFTNLRNKLECLSPASFPI